MQDGDIHLRSNPLSKERFTGTKFIWRKNQYSNCFSRQSSEKLPDPDTIRRAVEVVNTLCDRAGLHHVSAALVLRF
jgi:hypothetical protein